MRGTDEQVWPDDQEMRAKKDFKSTWVSQCFGGNVSPWLGIHLIDVLMY
jgi:hypothetical protein